MLTNIIDLNLNKIMEKNKTADSDSEDFGDEN
jgi:hypothetical protein